MKTDEVIKQLTEIYNGCGENCNNGYCPQCIFDGLCTNLESCTPIYLAGLIKQQQVKIEQLQSTLHESYQGHLLEIVIQKLEKEIEQLKANQPVLCKDCIMYTDNIADDNLRKGFCNRLKNYNFDIRKPNDYCSYGKRKESE